jgi:hypothetical protein
MSIVLCYRSPLLQTQVTKFRGLFDGYESEVLRLNNEYQTIRNDSYTSDEGKAFGIEKLVKGSKTESIVLSLDNEVLAVEKYATGLITPAKLSSDESIHQMMLNTAAIQFQSFGKASSAIELLGIQKKAIASGNSALAYYVYQNASFLLDGFTNEMNKTYLGMFAEALTSADNYTAFQQVGHFRGAVFAIKADWYSQKENQLSALFLGADKSEPRLTAY